MVENAYTHTYTYIKDIYTIINKCEEIFFNAFMRDRVYGNVSVFTYLY